MEENANIKDVARLAGVSVSTVSRVLNNHPDVSQATRDKVLKIINEQSYIPNNSARNLKRESAKAIGVLVKGLSNPFFISILAIIQKELQEKRYSMVLHQIDTDEDEIIAALSLIKEKKLRGLIFLGGNFLHSRDSLQRLKIPYVMLTMTMHHEVDRSTFSSVTVDDYQESYQIIDAACKDGHRKLAVIGASEQDVSIGRLRVSAFTQALLDNGIQQENNIAHAPDFTFESGYRAAGELLEKTKFTCLFCISDIIAIGAMRAIHDAGLRIPQDVSVIGFDGLEHGKYCIPSLATIKQPAEEIAHAGVKILLNHLRNGAPHTHQIFAATRVQGESYRPLN